MGTISCSPLYFRCRLFWPGPCKIIKNPNNKTLKTCASALTSEILLRQVFCERTLPLMFFVAQFCFSVSSYLLRMRGSSSENTVFCLLASPKTAHFLRSKCFVFTMFFLFSMEPTQTSVSRAQVQRWVRVLFRLGQIRVMCQYFGSKSQFWWAASNLIANLESAWKSGSYRVVFEQNLMLLRKDTTCKYSQTLVYYWFRFNS